MPVAALRRRAKNHCLDISDCWQKADCQYRTNRIVMHRLRASCSNAPLCHNMLSEQIRSYCKSLIASRTNRIAIPLRRCVMRRRLDKSDRIGIETCHVFHCATVSSLDIFGTTVSIVLYWSIALKLSHEFFFVRKIERGVLKIFNHDTAAQ